MTAVAREWIPGVAVPLPPGERVRWQGAPDRRALARYVFHARKIAIYFGLLIAWRGAVSADAADPLGYWLAGAVPLLVLGSLCVGCSLILARWTGRATVYAITDRRVVLKIGLLLQSTMNLPFRQIQGVSLRSRADGTGDIALRLGDQDRLAYLLLWPHARAWRLSHPEPTLRGVPDAARVAAILCDGVVGLTETRAAASGSRSRSEDPAPELVGAGAGLIA
jgi:hypothetical protein